MATKHDIFREHLRAWLKARGNREERRRIAAHVCFTAKVHPKSVSRAFRRAQMRSKYRTRRPGRRTTYGPDVTAALKEVWETAGEPCAENLCPLVPEYVTALRRDGMWHRGSDTTARLLAMSLGTMKKRVAKFRRLYFPVRGKSTTVPGAIRSVIPVRSGPWATAPAGTMQVDTVAHCGSTVAGDYAFTVNSTCVATLWGARRAQWNKGRTATVGSMGAMDDDVPFPVVEWHPDSGSEFINWHCVKWSRARGQALTRSRPNRKNDNCFVEERNGHVVRRWVRYGRFDRREIVGLVNAVYDVLTPYLNHFAASCRTTSKERIGSKWKITREKRSMTPYRRVLAREDVSDEVKAALTKKHEGMNPLVLKREIDRRLAVLFTALKRHESPAPRGELR